MISVAAGSVMRYYRVFPREDIKQMLIRAIDDIVENCTLDNGLFYYKELLHFQEMEITHFFWNHWQLLMN